jgi:hypothetical protein
MPTVELERTLVKSPPELWDELASESGVRRWFGEVELTAIEPYARLAWNGDGARGVIELEPSGWGTKVKAHAETRTRWWNPLAGAPDVEVEERLGRLLDELGSSALKSA